MEMMDKVEFVFLCSGRPEEEKEAFMDGFASCMRFVHYELNEAVAEHDNSNR